MRALDIPPVDATGISHDFKALYGVQFVDAIDEETMELKAKHVILRGFQFSSSPPPRGGGESVVGRAGFNLARSRQDHRRRHNLR